MAEPPAIQVARSVLDRRDRYLSSPGSISTVALMQAWDYLIGAPEFIARELSVEDMSSMVLAAATAVMSVFEICEGRLPKEAKDIGQRALGKFEVTVHGTTFNMRWGYDDEAKRVEWGWSATVGEGPEVVAREETLEAVCEALRAMPETNQ